jgi:hypothetical protein
MAVLTNNTLTVLANDSSDGDFAAALAAHGCPPLLRGKTRALQINVGKLCDKARHHCHVDAGSSCRGALA